MCLAVGERLEVMSVRQILSRIKQDYVHHLMPFGVDFSGPPPVAGPYRCYTVTCVRIFPHASFLFEDLVRRASST